MDLITATLIVLGAGFLVANARLALEYLQYRRRRRAAVLVWTSPRPPYYPLTIALGVATGILVLVKVFVVHRQVFGELMMFVYFAYLVPLSRHIARGFYQDGIWADSVFIPYTEVGGISWREGEQAVALIVISRVRQLARRLAVPVEHYGAARRLLRDKIGEREIHFGSDLDLGGHDERENA
ncbi:MAG TPA: hypothetical protein VM032_11920 [Vicinamibacterales bacterium]|nr:hypothetical protein [Vicinamibacterales bacterium]